MSTISSLLRKNVSAAQLAGFMISNLVGLSIIIAGLQFYVDVRSLWNDDDSFIRKDYLVINKRVTSGSALGGESSFGESEIKELESQPWVRSVGRFTGNDYKVAASIQGGGKSMSTYLFFESLPTQFLDVELHMWRYSPGSSEVPIILSRDYLTLYNFGFAASAGMPQITEQMVSAIPLRLHVAGENGKTGEFTGHIVGFSNRLNTILVPMEFMEWSNSEYGSDEDSEGVSRLIVDVSSPGDAAIAPWLESHGMEQAGDKNNSQASYFLNVVAGTAVATGVVITVLSLMILLLSVALLMQKNRDKLHTLIMLGYPLRRVSAPYTLLVSVVGGVSWLLAVGVMLLLRSLYIEGIGGMTGEGAGVWISVSAGAVVTLLIILFNCIAISRRVRRAF